MNAKVCTPLSLVLTIVSEAYGFSGRARIFQAKTLQDQFICGQRSRR